MEQVNINFQLKGIELLDINLNSPQIPLNPERIYNFNINIEQRISKEEKLVIVITSIDLVHEPDKQCHATIKTSCIFFVENILDFVSANSQQIDLPEHFIITLNSISLSTTRGIMFSQFKGTFMHHVLLPILDPSTLKLTKLDAE
ncbi:MAG TPA: hypothetical protein DCY35_05575 [Prolixibacteraceae bacterium]|nr:hypothetical protein [Prolixibacteraceae bacterium]